MRCGRGRSRCADYKGLYVTVSDVILDWSPLKLIGRVAQVDRLQAAKVDFARLPESDPKASTSKSSGGSFSLPVRVDLRSLQVDQAVIGAPVAGAAATLALTGSADLPTLTQGTVHLDARRLDSPGTYAVNGTLTPRDIQATITANEPAKGLIATIAHVPDVGPLAVQASVNGPRDNIGTQLGLTAGPLKASASGTIDLDHEAADLAVKAEAPAMSPGPGISWQSILVDAKVHGPFAKVDADGTVRIEALEAGGARIGSLAADVKGNAGQVNLHASVADLHIPGPKPDIFASAPIVLDASARLDAADRPVTFGVQAPAGVGGRVGADGGDRDAEGASGAAGSGPAGGGGRDGHSRQHAISMWQAEVNGDTTTASAKGRLSVTGGMAPVPALIGDDCRIDVAASMHGQDVTLSHLTVNGKNLDVSAQGGLADKTLDLNWTVALADLAAVQPNLSGKVDAKGHAGGALDAVAVQADIGADVAAKGIQPGHLDAHVDATGLPGSPHADVKADGTLLNAPLSLALTADQAAGVTKVDIDHASWKSLKAQGAVSLTPPAVIPAGKLSVDLGRLADLEPLIGKPIAGQAQATLDSDDQAARLALTVRDASLPGTAAVGRAVLNATVTDPNGHPVGGRNADRGRRVGWQRPGHLRAGDGERSAGGGGLDGRRQCPGGGRRRRERSTLRAR